MNKAVNIKRLKDALLCYLTFSLIRHVSPALEFRDTDSSLVNFSLCRFLLLYLSPLHNGRRMMSGWHQGKSTSNIGYPSLSSVALTFSFDIPSGMYSILIRATLRAILVVLTVNARVDVKKHRATTKAKNILLKVAIAVNVCYGVETIYQLRPTQLCWHEDGTMGTAVCCALCCPLLTDTERKRRKVQRIRDDVSQQGWRLQNFGRNIEHFGHMDTAGPKNRTAWCCSSFFCDSGFIFSLKIWRKKLEKKYSWEVSSTIHCYIKIWLLIRMR